MSDRRLKKPIYKSLDDHSKFRIHWTESWRDNRRVADRRVSERRVKTVIVFVEDIYNTRSGEYEYSCDYFRHLDTTKWFMNYRSGTVRRKS